MFSFHPPYPFCKSLRTSTSSEIRTWSPTLNWHCCALCSGIDFFDMGVAVDEVVNPSLGKWFL
jgi:hypothetical protein